MHYMKTKRAVALVILLTVLGLAPAPITAARAGGDNRAPDLPSPACDKVQVPTGSKMISHVYARGVQVYRWNGTAWVFVAPVATLFADAGYRGQVGIHYAGPTWESNSGSKVVAARKEGCSPDSDTIPWLLLEATSTNGPGIFSSVAYIHRVNTTGGSAPTEDGSHVDQSVEVPYTAEYYFYRAED
jgi:hypothetical protein